MNNVISNYREEDIMQMLFSTLLITNYFFIASYITSKTLAPAGMKEFKHIKDRNSRLAEASLIMWFYSYIALVTVVIMMGMRSI